MPTVDADIQFRLSGGAANSVVNNSFGGVMSSVAWTGGSLHDLFDAVTGDENAASTVEYRCIYVRNASAFTWGPNIKAWFSAVTAGGAALAIALDAAGVGNGTTTGVAATPVDAYTPPAGVGTFVTDAVGTSKALGLAIPNLIAGNAHAIWIRRTAAASGAQANDGATIQVQGDAI